MAENDGFIIHRTAEVTSSLPRPDEGEALSALVTAKGETQRLAQLAVSTLVYKGFLIRDYNDPEWHLKEQAASDAIARVFDAVAIKI